MQGHRRYRGWAFVVFMLAIVWAAAGPVRAQIDTGGISGTVTDQTGGAMPGATVTVTSATTGQSRTTVTNELGRYQVSALQPSRYEVKVELQGFSTVRRPDVT